MATFTIPIDAFATGQVSGNPGSESIQVAELPIADFVNSLPPPADADKARIYITIDDQYILTGDTDDDGVDEQYVPDGTPVAAFQVDVDGDGTADYEIRGQNPNDNQLYVGNQEGDNIARFNGNATIYDISTGDPVATLPSGNLYISSNGSFPAAPGTKPVVDDGSGTFTVGDPNDPVFPVCFTGGTLIETPDGLKRIDALAVGDLVQTLDHGAQEIRWIGSRKVSRGLMASHPALRPVRISAGALGHGLPSSDLVVSQQHRMLLSSAMVRHIFGVGEVLVAAKKLIGFPGIGYAEADGTEYFHILLDRHEVVIANGAASETLLPGPMAMQSLGAEARREILTLFPELGFAGHMPAPARHLPIRKPLREFLHRQVETAGSLTQAPHYHRQGASR